MIADAIRAAWYAVTSNRVRTLLTVGSVAVGVCAVVLMSSLVRSCLVTLTSGLEAMGAARLVAVFPKPAEGSRARYADKLSLQDLQVLRARVPHARWIAGQTVLGEQQVQAGGRRAQADLVAGDGEMAAMLRLKLAAGRLLAPADSDARARVAVMSRAVATRLFSTPAGALGQTVHVAGQVYTVVGVLQPSPPFAFGLGYDLDKMVLVPQGGADVSPSLILIGTSGRQHNATVAAVVTSILNARHHEADDFRVFDFAVTMDQFKKILAAIELLAGAIASVALLAGAAGTTNVLMVSVHEQIREIGVRKALGASGAALMRQFVLQALMIAGLGAAAGVSVGLGTTFLGGAIVGHFQPGWITAAAIRPMTVAVIAAFAVTALASLLPAVKVRNMTILDCLRARA